MVGVYITSPRATMAKLSAYGVLALVAIFFITPMLWLVLASLEPKAAVGASTPLVLSFSNFAKVLNWQTTFLPLINSAILSGGTAVLTVVAALFAAYPLSRYQMRFRKPFLYIIVFSTGLPITAILVPVYTMFARFDLVDNVPAVILFMTATSLPFGIWLMKGFMDGVPLDLEQAAWVDGATWLRSLRRIVAPLMMPGITVILIFTFAAQWGNFLCPVHPPPEQQQAPGGGQYLPVLLQSGRDRLRGTGGVLDPVHPARGRAVGRSWGGSCEGSSPSPVLSRAKGGSVHDDQARTELRCPARPGGPPAAPGLCPT